MAGVPDRSYSRGGRLRRRPRATAIGSRGLEAETSSAGVLETLAKRGSCICGEIVQVLPLSQATVSQHLKVLKEAGLIRGETDGPRSCYCLDGSALRRLRTDLEQTLGSIESCC